MTDIFVLIWSNSFIVLITVLDILKDSFLCYSNICCIWLAALWRNMILLLVSFRINCFEIFLFSIHCYTRRGRSRIRGAFL